MKQTLKTIPALVLTIILTLNLASAIVINSVQADNLFPGQEGLIDIEVENIFNEDIENVILTLNFQSLPFIPIGTSEQSTDEIREDKDERFIFRIKASPDITPGDYEIPYTLQYDRDEKAQTRSGTIGIKVEANPDLRFSISTTNAIENERGIITLRIVNQGFYDARFVNVKILPDGFTILSNDEDYIGSVDSDDFETTSFSVLFNKAGTKNIIAIVEYTDFNNKKIIENIDLPLTVYTQEKALELGIKQKSQTPLYIGTAIALILLYILYRTIKKRRRLKRSMNNDRS